MKKITEQILNGWFTSHQGQIIQYSRYIYFGDESVSWDTMRRYILVEPVVERCYYSVREIVDLLNHCAGDDCYGCDWHYEIDEEGRIYCDTEIGFRVVGWR